MLIAMKRNIAEICVVIGWVLSSLMLAYVVLHMPDAEEIQYCTHTLFFRIALLFVPLTPLLILRSDKVKWSVLDLLLTALAVLYIISSLANGKKISFVILQEVFPYVALYFGAKVIASIGGVYFIRFFILLIFISLGAESILGLLQVFGYESSGNAAFGMTGSFQNPGPFGGYIAILMSVAIVPILRYFIFKDGVSDIDFYQGYGKVLLYSSCIVLCLGMMVLPASQSRAGWLALSGAILLFAFVEGNLWYWIKEHRLVSALLSGVAVLLTVGMFLFKKDSALGRLHIWHIETQAIASSPFIGAGPGMALGAYGETQEQFFRTRIDDFRNLEIAGCPEYAFNEFLKVGIETGVIGLLIVVMSVIISVVFLLRERNAIAYGLVAASIFSFFSYPLSLARISVVIVIMLAISSCRKYLPSVIPISVFILVIFGGVMLQNVYKERTDAVLLWSDTRQLSSMEMYEDSAGELSKLYDDLFWNYRYLYDYGYALHKLGRYEESNVVMNEGAEISSDPMFHNILGKNYIELCEYDEAEREFKKAHYMVPGRLYPLILLMDMYYSQGKESDAIVLGKRILKMPVNENNAVMKDLHKRVYNQLLKWQSEIKPSGMDDNNNILVYVNF